MPLNLNDVPPRDANLIPQNTVCTLQMVIRPGNVGEGGWYKSSSTGALMLDCEFTVVDGDYAKRKLWQLLLLGGTTEGHAQMAHNNQNLLREMVESAKGIDPKDMSEAAQKARNVEFQDLQNLRFIARIGVVKNEEYGDKN